ncbi:MAG: DUF4040 domain-containing protein [Verrucomicrobia bacterium]|nr:DUF4040 domain-containing protein [Verrucomicrobiota bacterium]
MTLLWPILVLAGTGFLAPLLSPRLRSAALFALVPAAVAGWFAWQMATLGKDETMTSSLPWFGMLGAGLDFWLDGFGGLMALLATGIGSLIAVYASGYMGGHPQMGRFLMLLFGFMAAMVGVVVADNLILLFVFWELTSITSYLLIGFNHEDKEARAKALQALLVTGAGGLAMLAGLLLLGGAADSWKLSELLGRGEQIGASPMYPVFTLLILAGAAAKSAQVPLHFWLPNAMAAPTPVSAYLHSATMVKAGVFLLARLSPVLDGTVLWHGTLGGVTLLTGAGLGIVQHDLKRILAYTTLAVLGTLTMLIGVGTELALESMVVFLVGHALYKAALFMVAGTIDHGTGTRDVRRLWGLRRIMPFTATAALLAAFSKAGFPPFFGFIGKEYVYKTGSAMEAAAPLLLGVAVVGNTMLFALALKAGFHPFWSKRQAGADPVAAHEGPPSLWAPPLALALAGLALGLFPGWAAETVVASAVCGIMQHPVEVSLALWHGLNLPLLLSGVTIAGGFFLYRQRRLLWRHHHTVEALRGPMHVYERGLAGLVDFAKAQTRALQSGTLSRYIFIILGSTTALLLWKFAHFREWPDLAWRGGVDWVPLALCIMVMAGAVVATTTSSRITILFALGVVGLGIAVIFLFYSAPDLAITQILVEALTIILLLMVVHHLAPIRHEQHSWGTASQALLSVVFGLCMGLLVRHAKELQLAASIAETLAAWSYPEAHGRNVVNVILVDFRALDTFGEIVVLAIAAIGVAALLQREPSVRKERT